MASDRIEKFQAALRNLQLQPLLSKVEREKLWVDYDGECLDQLEQKVLDCTESTNQFLFAGHRGCGKSTLLYDFSQRMESQFFTVFFSISNLIQSEELNHINILFAIALEMMEKAECENVKISADKKQAFFDWFKERTQIEINGISSNLGFGIDLLKMIKGNLQTEQSIKEEIKTKFTQNFRDLIDTLNAIATEIKLATKREILVIVDDLDKSEPEEVSHIYKKNIKALLEPKFIIIYTVPIATIRDGVFKKDIEEATGNDIFVMPVLKLYPKGESHKTDGKPSAKSMAILQSVLTRRIDADLFAAGIEEKIALYSGGVLRDAVRIAQRCCNEVLVKLRQKARRNENIEDVRIDGEIFGDAVDKLRNDMQIALSKRDREILLQIYANYRTDDPKHQDFLDLLHTLVAIEYRNRESWYDVHPLMIEQLRVEKLIPAASI